MLKKVILLIAVMTISTGIFADCVSDEASMEASIDRYDSLVTKNDIRLHCVMDPTANQSDPSNCSGNAYDIYVKKYYITWRAGDWGNTLFAVPY